MTSTAYAGVMTIKRITISVPAELADRIKEAAGETPVSQWIVSAAANRLAEDEDLERQWDEFYRGLPPDPESRSRAREIVSRATAGRSRRLAA